MSFKYISLLRQSIAQVLSAAAALLAVASGSYCVAQHVQAAERPDVVFILLDDLRYDALSFLDHPYVETPHIDKLREQGAWMENAFVTTSICCPSRATFLTGTYASRHGVIDNETSEYNPEITPPVSKYLQDAGYRTAMIGKWHMGSSGQARPHFDEWLSFDGQGKYYDPEFIYTDGSREKLKGYTTDILTDRAIDFVQRQPEGQPFFLMLSHKAVHEPFQPAPRHKTAFGAKTMDPQPVSWNDTFEGKPEWQIRQRTRDVRWNWRTRDVEEEQLPDAIALEPWKKKKKYVDQLRCLAAVDDGVGRLVEVLRERGNLDNTLIVFTSDNGYFHLEHRRWDKRLAYEESLQDPEYAGMMAAMGQRLEAKSESVGWKVDVFPHNLPRVKGPEGILMNLQAKSGQVQDVENSDRAFTVGEVSVSGGAIQFNGASSLIKVPFDPEMDPSGWPYKISIDVNVESDGVIATQSSPGYGYKIFVQDGRPGVAVLTKTWIASRTTIDGPDSIIGKWTKLEAEIDYNRVTFWVDGEVVDSCGLPLPFKAKTKSPLIIGAGGKHKVSDAVPNNNFKGQIRSLAIQRPKPL